MFKTQLLAGLFFLLPFGFDYAGLQAQERPNIILFLVDDYDKQETSPYGGRVLTPNLDRLANEGMLFHNTHVTSTVCTASRYTFLTGRYAGSSTSEKYLEECPNGDQGLPAFNVGLEADHMNVGRVLANAGYATGFVGKYHVHDTVHQSENEAGLHAIEKDTPYSDEVNRLFRENERRQRELIKEQGFTWAKHIYWENVKEPLKGHNPEWTIQAALEFVEEHKDQPFYLHYCTTLLHGPNREWYRSLVDKERITGAGMVNRPLNVMSRDSVMERIHAAGLTENEAGYLWMDDSLGLLLDKLDDLGIAENTIVVFVSDHGSNKKGSLFKTRGTEIPCLIRWPKVIAPGTETFELVQNTDFVPTWFQAADADVPSDYSMDGVSLLPLFNDPQSPVRDYVYGEQGPARSIKTKDWNYISLRYTIDQIEKLNGRRSRGVAKRLMGLSGGISRGANGHPNAFDADQLYHLVSDPEEQENLAGDSNYRRQLVEMKAMLSDVLQSFPGRPYGEFVPGGNTTDVNQSIRVLEKLQSYHRDEGSRRR